MVKHPNSKNYTVGIVGAGMMGRGIAQVMALAGVIVRLYDVKYEVVEAGGTYIESMISLAREKEKLTEKEENVAIKCLDVIKNFSDFISEITLFAISKGVFTPVGRSLLWSLS